MTDRFWTRLRVGEKRYGGVEMEQNVLHKTPSFG